MMLKKRFCITLMFIANILLLAHSVIPHHHHNGIPHFEWFTSTEHHSDGDGECHDCCCHHENGGTCPFEQSIDAVYETKDDCSNVLCAVHNHHPGMLLQAILGTDPYDFSLAPENISPKEPPYLISYHCDYAGSGTGLRAPPSEPRF
jgi:hypothetical protein